MILERLSDEAGNAKEWSVFFFVIFVAILTKPINNYNSTNG